jgi:hypothetical protein
MAQLLQNLYNIAPILVIIALFGAAVGGFWLVLERNANRLRKIQLH